MTVSTIIPTAATDVVRRDANDVGYEYLGDESAWVFEQDGVWLAEAPIPDGAQTHGDIATALECDMDRLYPVGYVNGARGSAFLRAGHYEL